MALRRRTARAALVVALIAGALTFVSPVPPTATAASACDWPMYGHDPGRSFAATPGCSQLKPGNASTLLPRWVYPTSEPVTASTTVAGDTVYVGDWGGTFYALPVHVGLGVRPNPRWKYQIDDTTGVAFGRITSTAAVATVGGFEVVIFGGGATLYALSTINGAVMARACLDPRDDPAVRCRSGGGNVEIESSPVVIAEADGGAAQVLVGIDVHNDQGVGRTGVVSLRLAPFRDRLALTPMWKLDPESGETYTGDDLLTRGSGTGSGCAGVWGSPTVDVDRGLVFFGTSSCSVDGVTSGESVWSADLATGALRWHYLPPRVSTRWDDDFGASPNLLPGGVVGIGGKDGWYYALDEQTGALHWSSHVAESGHLETDFAVGGIIGSPATGLVRGEPAIFIASAISTPIDAPLPGLTLDLSVAADPGRMLSLSAIRASDGAPLWRNLIARASYGAPSYANGVVLVPSTFTFSLEAVDADTGLTLAVLPVHGAPSASPVAVGPSVFLGAGTSETDLEFKAFGATQLEPYLGSTPLSLLSGVYAFTLAGPALKGLRES